MSKRTFSIFLFKIDTIFSFFLFLTFFFFLFISSSFSFIFNELIIFMQI